MNREGTRLRYQSAGDGPTVVLANGLGGSFHTWRHLTAHLTPRCRVLSWSYRGLHGSEAPADRRRVRIEHHVGDLEDLLAHAGVQKALFLGWSMGAQLCFELYARAPERFAGVAVVNGTAGRPFDTVVGSRLARHVIPLFLGEVRRYGGGVALLARAAAAWPGFVDLARAFGLVSASLDEEVFRELAHTFADLDFALYADMLRLIGDHDAWSVLPSVRVPATIIAGDRDVMTPVDTASRMSQLIPNSRLVVAAGCTHYAPVEKPDVINAALDELIERCGAW